MITLTPKQQAAIDSAYHELDLFIRAAEGEGYADSITQEPATFEQLVKLERRFERGVAAYLKELAETRAAGFVNWAEYERQAKANRVLAAELMMGLEAELVENEGRIFLNVVFDFMLDGEVIGANAGSTIYNMPIDVVDFQTILQRSARKHAGNLVKGVTQTTVKAIRESVRASIELGEDVQAATKRLTGIVNDPVRAATIAHTEAVNSYGSGLQEFAGETAATGKWWDSVIDSRTSKICLELNKKYGSASKAIGINDKFISSYVGEIESPAAHVRCRSGMYLKYD